MSGQAVSRSVRRVLSGLVKAAGVLAAVGVVSLATLLLVMWREHKTGIALPPPTGHFAVGRTTFIWTNEAETEELAPPPGAKRLLYAWMWYPAAPSAAGGPADYLPAEWRAALAERQGPLMRTFFKKDLALVRTHSVSDAPVSREQRTYPVVILRAGGGALTTDFTTLAEDLASHGYFVAGFDAPYRSFVVALPDGRVIGRAPAYNVENANGDLADPIIAKLLAMWTSDSSFLVGRLQQLNEDASQPFAGRMNLQRLGIVGHSFGGATAMEFCHEDPRCKAALDLDGIPFGSVVRDGLAKPGMFILSDHSREMADPASREVLARIQSMYDRLPAARWYLVIRQANHFSFSDQILLNSQAAITLLRLAGFGGLDARRGLAISADYVHTFFDVYLNGAPPASLTSLTARYPEVHVEAR